MSAELRAELAKALRAPVRQYGLLAVDALICAASLWLAMLLRFDGRIPAEYAVALPATVGLLVGARLVSSLAMRLHRWSFRLSGLADGVRLGIGAVIGTLAFLALVFALQIKAPPRSVVVLELLLTMLAMAALRFSPRYASTAFLDWGRGRSSGGPERVIIIGAGSAGEMLMRDLQRSDEHLYRIVGYVDDDPGKWGLIVGGKTVLGAIDELPTLVKKHDVGTVLIAIPRLPAHRIRAILSLCSEHSVKFKILPVSFVYLNERVSASMLQDLSPEDLLPRDQVSFTGSGPSMDFSDRCALVTGAGGSIGGEICRQLLGGGIRRLVMVDINENALYMLRRRFEREKPQADIAMEIADVRDRGRMTALFKHHQPQDVFHAAAHKHVPLMEAAPCEAVKNNVGGTRVVAEAVDSFGAERLVFISTDKAVRPTSVMGASKRVGEMLVRTYAQRSQARFCAVRFGNVLGSAGSVVPIFREQIAAGGPVTVTHPEMRRYFMTINEAVGLVLKAGYGDYGALCVLDMGEQIRIVELARHMITMAGLVPDVDIRIDFSGLRPGEKLFEELLTEDEEKTSVVTHKIHVAESPRPPLDLMERIDDLLAAASREDGPAAIALLKRLVPSYHPYEPPVVLPAKQRLRRSTVA